MSQPSASLSHERRGLAPTQRAVGEVPQRPLAALRACTPRASRVAVRSTVDEQRRVGATRRRGRRPRSRRRRAASAARPGSVPPRTDVAGGVHRELAELARRPAARRRPPAPRLAIARDLLHGWRRSARRSRRLVAPSSSSSSACSRSSSSTSPRSGSYRGRSSGRGTAGPRARDTPAALGCSTMLSPGGSGCSTATRSRNATASWREQGDLLLLHQHGEPAAPLVGLDVERAWPGFADRARRRARRRRRAR